MYQKHNSKKVQEDAKEMSYRRYLCPVCGKHTILWLLPTTTIFDLPVKCNRCGKESIVNVSPDVSASNP